MAKKMTTDELKWQAESDARTMAEYQQILGDKTRMNRAIKEAERQAKDLNKRASAMQNAAKIRTNTRTAGRKK
jgi:hypothetical protein